MCHSNLVSSLSDSISSLKKRICFSLSSQNIKFTSSIPPIKNSLDNSVAKYSHHSWFPLVSTFFSHCFNAVNKHVFTPIKLSLIDKHLLHSLKLLSQKSDIVIKPADKNLGVCILSPSLYNDLCMQHLTDSSIYTPVTNFSIPRIFGLLRLILHKFQHLYTYYPPNLSYLARSLLQLEKRAKPCQFYVLPKVHKGLDKLSGRPIASSIGTATYHTSKYLHNVFFPLVKRLPYICLSSMSFLSDLLTLNHIPDTACILCADIKSLYPSIPTNFGLHAVKHIFRLYGNSDCHFTMDFHLELLEWVLNNNFITFNNNIYHQIKGTAMGTPIAVCYANMVLSFIEQQCLPPTCLFYRRYIDDVFAIFDCQHSACLFISHFHSFSPSIQFDAITFGRSGIFLDMNISISPSGSIVTELFQKEMNKYLYLPPFSSHNISCMKSVIRQELVRYRLLCSEDKTFLEIVSLFFQRLCKRAYSPSFLIPIFYPLPTRHSVLSKLSITPKPPLYMPLRSPVITLCLPHIVLSDTTFLKFLFTIPDELFNHPAYSKIFSDKRIIIGKKYFNSIGQFLAYKKFYFTQK